MKQLFGILVLSLAGCATVPAERDLEEDRSAAYRSCPGYPLLSRAENLSWTEGGSAGPEHERLRRELGRPFQPMGERVLVFRSARHWTVAEVSTVATRSPGGIWHVDQVGPEGSGLLQIEQRLFPPRSYDLSEVDSRRIDAMLRDPCLYAGPTFLRDPNIVSGGAHETVEISTRRRQAVFRGVALRTAEVDALLRLLLRN